MNIETYWLNSTHEQRLYVLADCGWRTRNGPADRTAHKAAGAPWGNLTPAMQAILTRKAREGLISA